jgi:hypothetical protein
MSEANTQTVVDETNVPAQQGTAADGARTDGPDLDTLLAQYETETVKPAPVPPSPPANQQQPDIDQTRLGALENRIFQEDLNKAVNSIVGDLKVPQRIAKGWIDQMAREDSRIASAFTNRLINPDAGPRLRRALRESSPRR